MVLEVTSAFAAGAALVIPPHGPLAGELLAEVVAAHRVTHALVPRPPWRPSPRAHCPP
ncbi:hypothetical protein NKH18_39935 [Streptomyces sp. M10(2022)]